MLQLAIPALPVADIAAALEVYQAKFGFEPVHADEGMAIVRRDGIELHLWRAGDQSWRTEFDPAQPVRNGAESFLAGTSGCRIRTTQVEALFEEFRPTGVLHPKSRKLIRTAWGTVEFHTLDLDGNLLTFFQNHQEG